MPSASVRNCSQTGSQLASFSRVIAMVCPCPGRFYHEAVWNFKKGGDSALF
jgi:hypothetical protein